MATTVVFHAHPGEAFELAFGTEWFIRRDTAAAGETATDVLAALNSGSISEVSSAV